MTTRKEILKAFFEDVWSRGDAEAVGKHLASSYKIHHDPGDPWDGKVLDVAGFQERLNVSRAPFPDQRFEIRELFEEGGGNAVVATWHWTGTHQGDMPGFPASGKTVRMSGMTVYYFEGERITGHWQVKDALGVFRQLRS